MTIEAGTSLFLWVNNDGPGGSDNLNISQLGGFFASTLDQDAYSIGLYWPNGGFLSFGVPADLVDHIQWNIDGVDNNQANARSSVAELAGLWSDQDDWISTTASTTRIELTDLTGGLLHDPNDYNVINPNPADFDGDGDVDAADLARWETFYGINANADGDGDGDSDGEDFLIWQREVVAPLSAVAALPEPTSPSICLVGLTCLGLSLRRFL